MSSLRYAKRRDDNESPLIALATAIGALMVQAPPLDYWCFYRGHWIPVEVKRPDKKGWKSEFTPAQILFLLRCKEREAVTWTWRTESDVLRDLNARRSA